MKNEFDLNELLGMWESVNLNPSVYIHKNDNTYILLMITLSEFTTQAEVSTHEIIQDEAGFYFLQQGKRINLTLRFNPKTLSLTIYGDYIPN